MQAIIEACRIVEPFTDLHIVTDSKFVVNGLTRDLAKWEDMGWIGVANAEQIQKAVALLRARNAQTTLRWVKGHSGCEGNEQADKLAEEGRLMDRLDDEGPIGQEKKYLKNGASLHMLTQKLAYKGIKQRKECDIRNTTLSNLGRIRTYLESTEGGCPSNARIWKSLRKPAIAKKVRDFMWKLIHGAHRVGSYWSHIPGYEDRADCRTCGVTETMEHILTECSAVGQKEIWAAALDLLRRKRSQIESVTYGLVMGAAAFKVVDEKGRTRSGATRLVSIVLTEAAYLIWVMRCERVIDWQEQPDKQHNDKEAVNRLVATINKRWLLDRALTKSRLAGSKTISKQTLIQTWSGLLINEPVDDVDWV
ncbi:hypothetical protein FKP32DRAFT_1583970, partial [Trametes sanguinea]